MLDDTDVHDKAFYFEAQLNEGEGNFLFELIVELQVENKIHLKYHSACVGETGKLFSFLFWFELELSNRKAQKF